MIRQIIRSRQIHLYYCSLLLYEADDDDSDITEELDNGKTNIMETGGRAMYHTFYMYLRTFLLGSFCIL